MITSSKIDLSEEHIIRLSQLFDAEYYLSTGKLSDKDIDPITHYCTEGWLNGLWPRADFDPEFYRKQNRIQDSSVNPFLHFIVEGSVDDLPFLNLDGIEESLDDATLLAIMDSIRDSKLFNEIFYLATYIDVKESGMDPIEHYVLYGHHENRWPRPDFDPNLYRESEETLGLDEIPFHHFISNGAARSLPITENTQQQPHADYNLVVASGLFDNDHYRDIINIFDPEFDCIEHFLSWGAQQGLRPRPDFDPVYYAKTHLPDNDPTTAFQHFIVSGKNEDLATLNNEERHLQQQIDAIKSSKLFDVDHYLLNPDLANAGIDPIDHYVRYGHKENRWPRADFDPVYYRETEDTLISGENPFVHFILNCDERNLPILNPSDIIRKADYGLILDSGLFDAAYYRNAIGVVDPEFDCIEHFLNWGAQQGLRPRGDFDPIYYADAHLPDNDPSRAFQHYIEAGKANSLPTVDDEELQHQLQVDLIKDSNLFDSDYYLSSPDLMNAGVDPIDHYVRYGHSENRWPRPDFDPNYYRQTEETITLTENPLVHYISSGATRSLPIVDPVVQNRKADYQLIDASGLFDSDFYRKALGVCDPDFDCIEHYLIWGAKQGLRPCLNFDPVYYAKTHLEDQDSSTAFQHYIKAGKSNNLATIDADESLQLKQIEDIRKSKLFDEKYYLSSRDLVNTGIDPIDHYVRYGHRENRWPRPDFDPNYYQQINSTLQSDENAFHHFVLNGAKADLPLINPNDVKFEKDYEKLLDSGIFDENYYRGIVNRQDREFDCIEHYLRWGSEQGLKPRRDFDPIYYSENYSVPLSEAFQHYIDQGNPPETKTIDAKEQELLLQYEIIESSGLLDTAFYMSSADIASTNVDPIDHYVRYGSREQRWPRQDFDPVYYRSITDGILPSENPLVHYIQNKQLTSLPVLDPSASKYDEDYALILDSGLFEENFYRKTINVFDLKFDCIDHYIRWGAAQGLQPRQDFNCEYYVTQISEKIDPCDAFQHYILSESKSSTETIEPNARKKLKEIEIIKASKLFDSHYYLEQMDLLGSDFDALSHYVWHGNRDNLWPRADFDPTYYRRLNEIREMSVNSLVHFIENGGSESDLPLVDPATENRKRNYKIIDESGMFDEKYYRSVIKIDDPDFDCIEHYLIWGSNQGLLPREDFEPSFYSQNYTDFDPKELDPFAHYISIGIDENRLTVAPLSYASRNIEDPSHAYDTYESARPPKCPPLVKTVAYYLPQFHPIEENDTWWGKGFTEWTNVTKARPLYDNHQQPRLPGDLGFYDLRLVDNLQAQVDLAKKFNVEAFCFHYYWFGGKRLLEKPLDLFLEHKELDLEFCLCWANENWSRRWDGSENHILMAQNHSPEDDLALAADLLRYMSDSRYLKVDGKPLLVVYRPILLPDSKATIERWREFFRDNGIGEVCFGAALTFEFSEPAKFGFDVGVEFPPHNRTNLKLVNEKINLNENFSGNLITYDSYAAEATSNSISCDAPLYSCVIPSWDNTARRGVNSTIFYGSTPKKFQRVTKAIVENISSAQTSDTSNKRENILFVNAWNEWAESAVLEPDKNHGYAYLNALSRSVSGKLYNSALVITKTENELLEVKSSNSIGYVEHKSIGRTSLSKYLVKNYDYIREFDFVLYCPDLSTDIDKQLSAVADFFERNDDCSSITLEELPVKQHRALLQSDLDILTLCQRSELEELVLPQLTLDTIVGFSFLTDILCRHLQSYLSSVRDHDVCYQTMDKLLVYMTTTHSRKYKFVETTDTENVAN